MTAWRFRISRSTHPLATEELEIIEDTALVATVVQFEIVFPKIMEDKLLHTIENGFYCDCSEYLRASLSTTRILPTSPSGCDHPCQSAHHGEH